MWKGVVRKPNVYLFGVAGGEEREGVRIWRGNDGDVFQKS